MGHTLDRFVRVNMKCTPEEKRLLERLAAELDASQTAVVFRALREFAERHDRRTKSK